MKSFLGLFLLLVLLAFRASALDVVLSWDAPPGSNSLSGYRVYTGTNSHQYYSTNTLVGSTNTSLTILGLVGGRTYYFAASSVVTNGVESDLSGELVGVLPVPPTGLRLKGTAQSANTLSGPWVDVTNMVVTVEPVDPSKVYRMRLDWISNAVRTATMPPIPKTTTL